MIAPLLLVDIDGVLSLWGFDPLRPPAGRYLSVDGMIHFLAAEPAARVARLAGRYELVWCSGWEEKADEHLPHALGLPAGRPHLSFGPPTPASGRHWKLDAIDAFAGPTRPLAWVDDGHDQSCHAWARARSAPTLLVATDPAAGLTAADAARLLDWADALAQRRPPPA